MLQRTASSAFLVPARDVSVNQGDKGLRRPTSSSTLELTAGSEPATDPLSDLLCDVCDLRYAPVRIPFQRVNAWMQLAASA
jgi:hypothetical protein